MLQKIRDRTTGWVASAIMVLLIIPFAFWGINYYFSGGQEPVVATVNGVDIKLTQFQRTFSNYRLQMQAYLGKSLTPEDEVYLKQQTLDKLIESELLNQVTTASGLRIDDQQVKEAIKNIDVFKGEDGFNKQFYEESVLRLGMPPAVYEQQMRLDMMSEQLQSAIVESDFITSQELEAAVVLENQLRDITYTIIPVDRFRDSIQVTDSDIEQFYKNNSHLYIKPESVKIAYLELALDKLAADVIVNEDDLRAYYEANKADYAVAEQRKVTQILIKTGEDASEDEIEKARTEAESILAEIHSGKTFKDIAEVYASNTDTNFSINEYGFLGKGLLQKEVDDVVYSMSVGDISDVIQSKQGFHIVKLEDIKGGVMNTFENSREAVEKNYRNHQAEQRFFDLSDQLGTLSYEHSDNLETAAEATGLQIRESDWFDRKGTGTGIISSSRVVDASFSEDVLINGHNSDVLEITDRDLVVLRVIGHNPEAIRPLEEVREDIIKDIKFTQAGKQSASLGQQVINELRNGKDYPVIAEEHDIKWQVATDIKRDDDSLNRAVLRTAFSLGQPADTTPVIGGVALGTGDYAVVTVRAVKKPDMENFKKEDIENTRIKLETAGNWQQYLQQLRAEADITLYRDRIQ